MNPTLALLRREWLQHRFGWLMMATLPTALMFVLIGFGSIEIGDADMADNRKAAVLALAGALVPSGLHLLIFWAAAVIMMAGLARRDHGDRSIEFWLSMPVGHAQSLATPLLTHMLLVPLAAVLIGLVSGALVSIALVLRFTGLENLPTLPWLSLAGAALMLGARLALGTLLATIWLAPVILGVVVLGAWFGKWGLVIGGVGLGIGSAVMDRLFGQPWLWNVFAELFNRAGRSLINAGGEPINENKSESIDNVLRLIPQWLTGDAMEALRLLASPWLVGVLLVSAALFAALVFWRRQGAGSGS